MKEYKVNFTYPIKQINDSSILLEMGGLATIEIPLEKDTKSRVGDIILITFSIPDRE